MPCLKVVQVGETHLGKQKMTSYFMQRASKSSVYGIQGSDL